LDALIDIVRMAPKNTLLIGDFNLPDIDWEAGTSSARSRAFLETVEDRMMEQMVEFSTQIKGNCLDLVLTNIPERVSDVTEAGRLGKSDHEMLLISLEMDRRGDCPSKKVTNWRLADWDGIRYQVSSVNWTQSLMGKSAHR